jgi:ABC-type uncharacterized transport system auxiliary subunit
MKRRVVMGLVMMGVVLAGCGVFGGSTGPDRTYVLRAAPTDNGPVAVPGVLSVLRPAVQPGLDLDRIALVRANHELHYYASSRWGETLPRVLSALLVESLAGAQGFGTVVAAERAAVVSDYELLLTVRRFEAEETGHGPPTAQVKIECLIAAGNPRRVLGRCDTEVSEPAAANRMGEIVAALERAAQKASVEIRGKAVAATRAGK